MKTINNEYDVFALALIELQRARQMYPDWPADPVNALSIFVEEVGELVQATNNLFHHDIGNLDHVHNEGIQAMAMGLRFLVDTSRIRTDYVPVTSPVMAYFDKTAKDNGDLRKAIAEQDAKIEQQRLEINRLHTEILSTPIEPNGDRRQMIAELAALRIGVADQDDEIQRLRSEVQRLTQIAQDLQMGRNAGLTPRYIVKPIATGEPIETPINITISGSVQP